MLTSGGGILVDASCKGRSILIETVLALLGLGQAHGHKAEERMAAAASHISLVEKTTLEIDVKLSYEINRIRMLAVNAGIPAETALKSLLEMQAQNEQLKELAATNRKLLHERGASAHAISELERWAGTCQVIPMQVDMTVQQIEEVIAQA